MPSLPGETPTSGLSEQQMTVLGGFVSLHLAISNADIQSLQYYDLASANLRDWPALADNLDLQESNTYYSALAGIIVGTECAKGLIEVNEVPLGDATSILVRSLDDIAANHENMDELSGHVVRMFGLLLIDLDDADQRTAAFCAAIVGSEWTEGIATAGKLTMTTSAEITRVSFARLCPVPFET